MTIERHSNLECVRAEWIELAKATSNVFATWEWNEVWWRHLGRGGLVVLALRTPQGSVQGILPMYRRTLPPIRILRLLGHGPADQAALVCPELDGSAVAELISAARQSASSADLLLAEQWPATWPPAVGDGATVLGSHPAPFIRFGGVTWSQFLGSLGSGTRASIRRKERRLERRRTVTLRLADTATLSRDLDILFSLHAKRWPGSAFGSIQPFHREFASLALANGWLRLWILELDGTPAAAWYGFRYGGAEHYYQSGWDPAFAADSVGQVLLVHTIRSALEDGVAEYRFGRGGEPYKSHYAKEVRSTLTVAWPRTTLGAAAVMAAPLALRLRRARRPRRTLPNPA